MFTWKECLLMCGVSACRCIGLSFVRWLFGSSMVNLLLVLFFSWFCLGDSRPLLLSACVTAEGKK